MSGEVGELGTASLSKIASLRPDSQGLNLLVSVLDKTLVLDRQSSRVAPNATNKIVECTVGDESGAITLIAKNEQADLVEVGKVLSIRNGRVDMIKGSMRLAVGQNGSIQESSEQPAGKVKADYNMSLIEFETVLLPPPAPNGVVH